MTHHKSRCEYNSKHSSKRHDSKSKCKPEHRYKSSGFTNITIPLTSPDVPIPATFTLITKGNPVNPLAFFVHGFGESPESWKPLMDQLSNKYYCVAPYLRGFYPTTSAAIPPVAETVNVIVGDLVVLTSILADPAKKNIFIAHDIGAVIAPFVFYGLETTFSNTFYFKYISLGNILPSVSSYILPSGDLYTYEQAKASFYIYLFQITPITGNFLEDQMLNPINAFMKIDFIKNSWKIGEPEGHFPIDVQNAENAQLNDFNTTQQNITIALNLYRNIFLANFPVIPIPVSSLYFIGDLDPFIVFQKNKTLKDAVIQESISTAVAPIYFDEFKCAGHWPHVSFPRKVYKKIWKFLTKP